MNRKAEISQAFRSAVFSHFLPKISSQLPPLSFFSIQTVLMTTKCTFKTHGGLEERSACITPCVCVFLCAVCKPKVVDSADFYRRSCASCHSVPTLWRIWIGRVSWNKQCPLCPFRVYSVSGQETDTGPYNWRLHPKETLMRHFLFCCHVSVSFVCTWNGTFRKEAYTIV